jgi:hypothetical protein
MKTKLKIALELMDKGLTPKTLSKMTEGQIKVLHNRLVVNEQVVTKTTTSYEIPTSEIEKGVTLPSTAAGKKMTIQKTPTGIKATPSEEKELDETETDDVTDQNALGADALQNLTGQEAPHMANDMAPDGMDDDSDDKRSMMGMSEAKKDKNPWAICTAQLGKEFGTKERHLWSAKEKNKYERCVKDVKKSLKEGKNPVSLFLENEIMKIVEKNLPPRITKGDLVKYLTENSPATAPSKPATKPTTKPGKPSTKPRPKHPGKNPNPGENPAPKAKKVSAEKAKDEVIDLIMNLLEK